MTVPVEKRGGETVCKNLSEEKFIYLGFYVAFNTVQVISRRVVLWAEETVHTVGVKVLYCKLPTNGQQLPIFPHKVRGLNRQPQRWEASVLPLCPLSEDKILLYVLWLKRWPLPWD